MTLFETFGWHTPLADYLSRLPESYPDAGAPNFKDALWSYRGAHDCAATCAILVGDQQAALTSARECVRASIDHFHGNWRKGAAIQSNQPKWNPYDWFNNAPDGLFWGSIIGDWQSVALLARFPRVPPKWEWPDHAYFGLLGFFLRGESLEHHVQTVDFILGKKKHQPKLLLDCLLALASRSATKLQEAWVRYLEYFLKHERNKDRLTLLQSRNASFYAAAAKYHELPLDVPDKYKNYVVASLGKKGG